MPEWDQSKCIELRKLNVEIETLKQTQDFMKTGKRASNCKAPLPVKSIRNKSLNINKDKAVKHEPERRQQEFKFSSEQKLQEVT